MRKIVFCTACAAAVSFALSGATVPVTNVWTGAGGNYNWSNMSNWEAMGGGTPAAVTENVFWDFSALEAGATVVDDYSGAITCCGLKFGENKGRITLSASSTGCYVKFLRGGSGYFDTYFTIGSGTTVDIALNTTNGDWTQWVIYIQGGGAAILSGARWRTATTQQIHVKDIDFTLASTLDNAKISGDNRANESLSIYLESNDSILRIERNFTIARLIANVAGTSPKIYRNGYVLTCRWMSMDADSIDFYGKFMDGGRYVCGVSSNLVFKGSVGGSLSSLDLEVRNAKVSTGDGVAMPATDLTTAMAGRFVANTDVTLSSVTNISPESGVEIAAGRTVSIAGAAGKEQYLTGSFRGKGNLEIACGSGGGVLMTGASDYEGTTAVRSGSTLRTRRGKSADGLLCYLNFEADTDALDIMDVVPGDAPAKFSRWLAQWKVAKISSVGGSGGGKCLHFDGETGDAVQNYGYEPVPDRIGSGMTGDYSIVMWLKPDDSTMEDETARPGHVMEVLYSRVYEYNCMNWIRFEGKNALKMGGFNGNIGDVTINLDGIADFFDGDWHQLAWTYSAGEKTFRTYIDGVRRSTWTRENAFSLNSKYGFILGARTGGTALKQTYDGDMDNFQLWGKTLSEDEIAEDWARKGNIAGKDTLDAPHPVAQWKFDDPSDIGKDSSGNGNDLEPVDANNKLTLVDSSTVAGVNGKAVYINSKAYLQLATLPEGFPRGTNAFTVVARAIPYNGSSAGALFKVTDPSASSLKTFSVGLQNNGWPAYSITYLGGDNFLGISGAYGFVSHFGTKMSETYWDTFGITYEPECRDWGTNYLFRAWHCGSDSCTTWASKTRKMEFDGTCSMYLGYNPSASGDSRFMNCYIDEMRVYGRRLSNAEMEEVSRELGSGGGYVLPSNSVVTVDAGGTLSLGSNQKFASISGSGTLDLFAADLTLTGASAFAGTVAGGGSFKLPAGSSLSLTGSGGGYTGYIRTSGGKVSAGASFENATAFVESGTAISTDMAGTGMPLVSVPCKVVLPASGSVAISDFAVDRRSITLVSGSEVSAPGGLDGWTVSPASSDACKMRLRAEGGSLRLDILPAGLAMIVK